MELASLVWDFLVHLDTHLADLAARYGVWIYAILFAIVFCETGLVVTPFLPGDSLLFVAGAVWAAAGSSAPTLALVLAAAALCGDNVNYWTGRYLGPRVFRWEGSRLFNRRALDRTHQFYERYGGKAVILARFVPLVRTFAPFVAGVGRMQYRRFLVFSLIAAAAWVGLLVSIGYFFGNVDVVKNNLTIVILGIVALSLTPVAVEFLRARRRA